MTWTNMTDKSTGETVTEADFDALQDNLEYLKGIVVDAVEVFIPIQNVYPSTTGGCAAPAQVEYGTNDVDMVVLDFDQTTDEYAQFQYWMPNTWDAGTVTAQFIWTAAAGSGDVIWGLQGRSYADDDAIDQAWGTPQTITDTLLAVGDIHVSAATPAITLAGTPAAGQFVQFRVYRDADADDLTADARLKGIKFTYVNAE